MKKAINIGLAALMVFAIAACGGEKTVTIGNQKWMLSNLNDASKGGKCYENKPENCEKYGRLYIWEEATKACPSGWHLPNNAEWEALVSFAGGVNAAGGKLKAKSGWEESGGGTDEYGFLALPGGGGTDEYGFLALPSGVGTPDGSFGSDGKGGNWWSATGYNTDNAYSWRMGYDNSKVSKSYYVKSYLFSVRCVKD